MSLYARKLDLNKFKKLYVKNRIENDKFTILPNELTKGNVIKIKGFGSLNIEGYEHGFLYLPKGSSVKFHEHINEIEMYKLNSGDKNALNSNCEICLLDTSHGINTVECDTIIETFKLNKNIIEQIDDLASTDLINECLILQLNRYAWRLDELLNRLSLTKYIDISWRPNRHISYIYDISMDSLDAISDVYFSEKLNLPYINLSEEEVKSERIWETVPYLINGIYKYKLTEIQTKQKTIGKLTQNI